MQLSAIPPRDDWADVLRRLHVPPSEADAVVALDADRATVENLLHQGHYVLAADPTLSPHPRLVNWNPDRYLPSRQLVQHQRANLGQPGLVRLHRLGEAPLWRDLDLVPWLVGSAPHLVFAVRHETTLTVHLGFPDGPMALINHAPGPDHCELHVIATSGAAYDHGPRQMLFRADKTHSFQADEQVVGLSLIVQAFLDDIAAAGDLSTSYETLHRIHAAVERSIRTGQAEGC